MHAWGSTVLKPPPRDRLEFDDSNGIPPPLPLVWVVGRLQNKNDSGWHSVRVPT